MSEDREARAIALKALGMVETLNQLVLSLARTAVIEHNAAIETGDDFAIRFTRRHLKPFQAALDGLRFLQPGPDNAPEFLAGYDQVKRQLAEALDIYSMLPDTDPDPSAG